MESRKVQKVGLSTLAVSLPIDWVKAINLKPGDLVFFEQEQDGSIRLLPKMTEERRESKTFVINADLCNEPRMIERIVVGNYILGHDAIKIVSSKRLKVEHVEEIRNVVRTLMGIGIMEETPNYITLQCSIDTTKFPVPTLLRRLYIITSTMHKEATDSLFEFDPKLAEETTRRESEANIISWTTIRLLCIAQRDRRAAEKMEVKSPLQILCYRIIAKSLEEIADWADDIARTTIELGKSASVLGKQLMDQTRQINDMSYGICHKAITGLFSKDITIANSAIESYNSLEDLVEKLQEEICAEAYMASKSFSVSRYFTEVNPCVVAQLSHIIDCIKRIAELGKSIAEVAINMTLEEPTKICVSTDEHP